jgi:uncharacterized damage-inducible protein DinB
MIVRDLLANYARYNQWAHKKLLDLIIGLSEEQQQVIVPSSFDSLYKTVFHVWGSESLWLGRLNLAPITIIGDPFNESMEELAKALEAVDQLWVQWVESRDDNQLCQKLNYHNTAGLPFTQSYDLLLQHIFNHSTYHNGQIVTILRAIGITKIPATDFAAWTFTRNAERGTRNA